MSNTEDRSYEAPAVVEIGSVHELTLRHKILRRTDGFTFQGDNVGRHTDPVAS